VSIHSLSRLQVATGTHNNKRETNQMITACKTISDIRNLRSELGLKELHIDHQLHVHVRLVWSSGEESVFAENDIAGMERYIRDCEN
jgi:DNA-binding transcriptional regulator YiaG